MKPNDPGLVGYKGAPCLALMAFVISGPLKRERLRALVRHRGGMSAFEAIAMDEDTTGGKSAEDWSKVIT
jgi:hypothetical protein